MSLDATQKTFADVTFLPLDINIEEHCSLVEAEIMQSYETLGFWSTYQGCWMLPLWTSGSGLKESELIEKSRPFSWTKAMEFLPGTRAMIEKCIFPKVHGQYRVVALITPPGINIKLHADCNFEDIGFLNHKLRFSISGNISSLWFLNEQFEKVFVSSISRVYLLDGSHPHGVDAASRGFKITLCIGSPWSGDLSGDFLNLMQKSEEKFTSHVLWRSQLGRPIIRDIFIDKLREAEQAHLPDPRDLYVSMIGK